MGNRPKPRKKRFHDASDVGIFDDQAFNRVARSACDACGGAVQWVDADRARAHGVDLDGAAAFFGLPTVDQLEIWICTRCDNGGVMGPPEHGMM